MRTLRDRWKGSSAIEAIRLVCATRQPTREDFFAKTALGRSLSGCYTHLPAVGLQLYWDNSEGLPAIYNRVIDQETATEELLVFLHDDVHLVDFLWPDRLREAIRRFAIVGLAGCRRRAPRQPSWAFADERLVFGEAANLSGRIAHGTGFPATVSDYGPAPRRCVLLDGLLLAVRRRTLRRHRLRFDERFRFHFYEMDFCRRAEQLGISMGTWPIAVVHESGGNFDSEDWRAGRAAYFDKWGD